MRILTLIILFACIIYFTEAHSKAQRKKLRRNLNMFKKLKSRAKVMEETLANVTETLLAANKTASAATRLARTELENLTNNLFRHTSSSGTEPDDLTILDATFASNQCGSFVSPVCPLLLSYPDTSDSLQLESQHQLLQCYRCGGRIECVQQGILHPQGQRLVPHLCLQQVQEHRQLQRRERADCEYSTREDGGAL